MFYAKIYRYNEKENFWTFRFKSDEIYKETIECLENLKEAGKCSKYKYVWHYKPWRLESVEKISDFPKEQQEFIKGSTICRSPLDLIHRIDDIHRLWDELISTHE